METYFNAIYFTYGMEFMLYLHIIKSNIMKNQILTKTNFLLTALMIFLTSPLAFAQEDGGMKIDVDVTRDTDPADWMTNPLYWVIGGLVLILIIALVARGGRK